MTKRYLALVGRLLTSTVLVPARSPNVIAPLDARSVNDGMTVANFKLAHRNALLVTVGPNGGLTKRNAVDDWLEHEARITVEGLRLRPDQPEGIYTEDGKRWLNVYHAPRHPRAGGSVETAILFFEQLLPDPRELHWFLQYLAFKFRNPGVPGPGMIMVAKEHGTGRGMLAELIKRLFGVTYVKGVSFDIFVGKNYQGQYTDWLADALFVVVNESSVGEGASVHSIRRDTYERLKDLVDPRATMRLIVTKGQPNYQALCFASVMVFTNHPDALPLPPNDRRFAVLTNGQPREQAFWDSVVAWMDQPENIGALARYLEDYNLAGYSPYVLPLMTKAKAMMSDMADSDIDRAFASAVAKLPGELITQAQIEGAMSGTRTAEGLDFHDRWREVAGRLLKSKLERIGEHRGRNWAVLVGAMRVPVYARTADIAKRWTEADADEIRAELAKNDPPVKAEGVLRPFNFG